ncbi:alanine--tRNA ligase [Actinomyces denticolens]|nr:alanine--tRNA ligase [Actinomyces denticolens]
MDDAGGVDGAQGVHEPMGEIGQVAGIGDEVVGPLAVDLALEGGTLDELGDDEGHAVRGLGVAGLDVEDAGHAGVPHPGQDLGLPVEAAPGHGVGGDLRVEDLHGDAVAGLVGHLPDRAHAPGAEAPQEPVAADGGARPQSADRRRKRGGGLRHAARVPAEQDRP